jgi:hypothetical protein
MRATQDQVLYIAHFSLRLLNVKAVGFSVIMTFNNTNYTTFEEEYDFYYALTQELATYPPIRISASFSDVAERESPKLGPVENKRASTIKKGVSAHYNGRKPNYMHLVLYIFAPQTSKGIFFKN